MATIQCENCKVQAVKSKDGYVCPNCGGTFRDIDGETVLVDVGEYDDLKKTVTAQGEELAAIKARIGLPEPKAAGPEPTPDTPKDEDDV